jgi:thioredoxin-related protein
MELLVVELDGCIYCLVFRRDVLPSYQASTQAKTVPIRFIELNAAEEQKFPFAEPVTMVPTILLMKGGREVGRISGYLGPENFFHAVNHMISAAP